jgi:hypothetical protein
VSGDLGPLIVQVRAALVLVQAATVLGVAAFVWVVLAGAPLGLLGWLPYLPARWYLARATRRVEAWTRQATEVAAGLQSRKG